jgi:prepilin-type N-terminal cleavage/methylation domain-containing protein
MSYRNRTAGFTLIELMIVVVIIGILASIAIPKWETTKGKANTAALRSDLRNLAVAEESYFYEHQTYTDDLSALKVNITTNVALTFATATSTGWAATATHAVASPATCGIFVGSAAPPIAAASKEGRVGCQ